MKYGRLTVIETFIEKGRRKAICKCDCGNTKTVQMTHLKSGATKSCGCYHKDRIKETKCTHGKTRTSLHNRWKAIKQRCCNPNNKRYKDYGARGKTLCNDWLEFKVFEKCALDNGYAENLTLDRIDNNKGYSPDNCRWVTTVVNNRNRRTTANIEGKPLKEVSEEYGIKYTTLRDRYYNGKIKTLQDVLIYVNQLPTK